MKKKILFGALVACFLTVITACTSFKATGLSFGAFEGEFVGTFETTVTVWKFLGDSACTTLFNVTEDAIAPAVKNAIREELEALGADAAINVTIEQKATFIDMLANGISGSILAPEHITIKGTAIRF